MDNELKVIRALEQGSASYAELEQCSGVPEGSFGRVIRGLVERGVIVKSGQNYHLPDSDSSGGDSNDGAGEEEEAFRISKAKYGIAGAYDAQAGGTIPYAEVRRRKDHID